LAAGVMLLVRSSSATRTSGGTAETIGQIESYGFAATTDAETASKNPLGTLASSIGHFMQRFLGTGEHGIRRQLLAAGMYDIVPATIVGYRLLCLVGVTVLWLWLAISFGFAPAFIVITTIGAAALGWTLPMTYLNRRARQRTERIERELPELIDLLVVTLEAGLSFLASLHMAAARLRGPLGEELRLALHEQRLGLTANDALNGMLRRAETPALRTFV